jgi:diaminopimelate decarboxylase
MAMSGGPDPGIWGLERRDGRLHLDGHDLTALAAEYGTPLHVASARILRERCTGMRAAFASYPWPVSIHFSYKTNPVAGVLRVIHDAGLGAEVVDGYELWLALRLGVPAERIVFNGPNKTDDELRAACAAGVGLIVVDALAELERLTPIAAEARRAVPIALRLCPDVVPRGMNISSLTGSRRNQFGLDAPSGELAEAIARAARDPRLRLAGMMAHIGSGIHDLGSFRDTVERLLDAQLQARAAGAEPWLLDIGGGLGTERSHELTTLEMLGYLGLGRMPRPRRRGDERLMAHYAGVVTSAVVDGCRRCGMPVPELVLEPGRALVSDAQVLLLTVGAVRERRGVGRFAIADGGAMTVSMMFLSEYHAVLLVNREAPDDGRTSLFGRLPSPMDVVYRNCPLPRLAPGDVLAVMDAGAYFTSTATNFGGPRPGVVLLEGPEARLVRRRETYEDLARVEITLS